MKLRSGLVSAGLALAAGIIADSPPARAETSATSSAAEPGELARMRYRQGVDAYRAGRFRESIDYFLEADTLSPSAALSFNIARAYDKIDDPKAALRWYRDYLRRAPDAKDRTETEALVHGFEARLAQKGIQQITVLSTPAGATVLVDDRALGVTPLTTEIAPGSHRVDLRLDGYAPATAAIELAPDHAEDVSFKLTAQAAPPSAAAPSSPPTPTPVPTGPEPAPTPRDEGGRFPTTTLGWTLVGAGGAALGTALVFEILRRNAESDAEHETTQVLYADRLDTMQSRQTAARIFAGAGAALAVGGGVLVWVGSRKRSAAQPAVTAACVPSACWSTVRGTF